MNYNTISKHVDIVLLGSFNPAIFHPEWFIKNNIIAEWEYTQKDILFVPDVTRVSLPSERYLAVLPDQFSIRATMPSDFLGLRDIVTSTFTLLKETPINQMGLNYTAVFKLSKDDWVTFGKKLVPTEVWTNSAKYFSELDDKKKEQAGLLALTMHLPRPDELNGFILSRLRVKSFENYEIIFEINNHIEIENKDVSQMLKILESSWEKSLLFAETYIGNILNA